jgi:catechol 2,3-dioxygenase-like lactoylglutathione lyase family enzyme
MSGMRLDAIGVSSTNLKETVRFYSLLGFNFGEFEPDEQHVEGRTEAGGVRLMIDSAALLETIIGSKPIPSNHSSFAVKCEDGAGVDAATAAVRAAGFRVAKDPWDAFWGQRYAILADPDGYLVDLFAQL